MRFAPQLDASLLNLAPSSCRIACPVTWPNPVPITTIPSPVECIPSKLISGWELAKGNFLKSNFRVGNPRRFNFTASTCWHVQSILKGGGFSCPKQADASASGKFNFASLS